MAGKCLFIIWVAAWLALPGAAATRATWPDPLERQTWQTDNGLPQNTVHALLQTADGFLWVATEGGLARFDGQRFQVYNVDAYPQMQSDDVRALAEGETSAVWAATAGGAVLVRNGELRNFGTADGLPSQNVLSITRDRAGTVRAETASGWARWDGRRFVATAPEQVSRTHSGVIHFATGDPLSEAGILCQLRDREGNVWIGTETRGLTVLRLARFNVFGSRQGLAGDSVRCLFGSRDGALWIGTGENGLTRYRDGEFTSVTARDGLASDLVFSLGEAPDGTLLVGTPDGLNRVRDGKISLLTSADGLADDFVRSIAADKDVVYAGTRRGLTVLRGDAARTFTEADGLGSNLVGALLPTDGGALWIATLRGLSRLTGTKVETFTTRDGLTSDTITALYRDRNSNLWIGTQGGSLNYFAGGRFRHFAAAVGLPKVVFGIAEDDGGNLWLAASTGVFRVDRRALLAGGGEAVAYGTGDGLRVNECSGGGHPAVWRTRDGTLWFATPRGVAAMTRAQAPLNLVPPQVAIETVTVDDRATRQSELRSIAPGHSRYAFEYAGLSFVAPQKVRYRYKLEGFDRTWIDAGTRRVAYYTNLGPGDYAFRVMARNNDGVWSTQDASVRFSLEPHVYQRWWFLLLCVIGLGLAAYSAYRLRVRQVAAQYDAVLAERNRIAREIHDTLAQGFAGISVQLEVVSRLIGGSAEEARLYLNEARTLVRDSLAEARRSIWELRSQSGVTDDLAARIGKLTTSTSEPRITLEVQGTFRPLAVAVENELLRIAQESVRNAVKHAHAQRVAITLVFEPTAVRLMVTDDGCGFDAAVDERGAAQGHFGLAGLRERAQQMGGRLTIESAKGKGTMILVEVAAR